MVKLGIRYRQGAWTRTALLTCAVAFGVLASAASPAAWANRLDPSFGHDGLVFTRMPGQMAQPLALTIDSKGRPIAGGSACYHRDNTYGCNSALARYMPNGSRDRSFSGDGRVITQWSHDFYVDALVTDADRRVIAAGGTCDVNGACYGFGLARYRPSGSLDNSFGNGGRVRTEAGGALYAMGLALDSQGRVLAGGSGTTGFPVARYTPSGTLDPTFGEGGTTSTDVASCSQPNWVESMAIDRKGRIVGAGFSCSAKSSGFGLVRYEPDGALDRSFGKNGVVTTGFAGRSCVNAVSAAIDRKGRIIAAGRVTNCASGGDASDFALARYEPNGKLDPTFGSGGRLTTGFAHWPRADARSVALDSRGRIVVAGTIARNGSSRAVVARYRPSGALDRSFSRNGKLIIPEAGDRTLGEATAVEVDRRDRIVIAGSDRGCEWQSLPVICAGDFVLARLIGYR
jgi:uncharacterized delta-60 repeat protein